MKLSELVKILSAELDTCGDFEVLLENAEFKITKQLKAHNLEIEVIDGKPYIIIRE